MSSKIDKKNSCCVLFLLWWFVLHSIFQKIIFAIVVCDKVSSLLRKNGETISLLKQLCNIYTL